MNKTRTTSTYKQTGTQRAGRKITGLLALGAMTGALLLPIGARAQTAGSQSSVDFKKQIVKTLAVKYLLYLPDDYGKDAQQKWPLMIFLHGSGESGDDLEKVKAHGPPKLIAAGKAFPFIVVSPQSPGGGWNTETLNAMLDDLLKTRAIDEDRVYLTGLSMGGFGTWAWAQENPERFAAIAPICGGGLAWRARRLQNVPTWAFHGVKDPTVPVRASEEMVDAMKKANALEVKLTEYPEAGHDSWTVTYNNPELFAWFLQHTRPDNAKKAEEAKKTVKAL